MSDNILFKLLSQENEAFYWIGFLIADGHFNQKQKSIQLEISKQDKNHIEKLLKYLEISNILIWERKKKRGKHGMVAINLPDAISNPKIMEKFGITSNKTINPPNFELINNKIKPTQMLSMIIGLIDGDGHIRITTGKRTQIALEMHGIWFDNLLFIEKFISKELQLKRTRDIEKPLSKLNSRGHSRLVFSGSLVLKSIKIVALSLKIPLLERKWSLIDETYVTEAERVQYKLDIIKTGIALKKRVSEIALSLKVSSAAIKYLIKRYFPELLPVLSKNKLERKHLKLSP